MVAATATVDAAVVAGTVMESGRLTKAMETLTLLGDTVMAEPPATQYSTLALLLEAMANP